MLIIFLLIALWLITGFLASDCIRRMWANMNKQYSDPMYGFPWHLYWITVLMGPLNWAVAALVYGMWQDDF